MHKALLLQASTQYLLMAVPMIDACWLSKKGLYDMQMICYYKSPAVGMLRKEYKP